MNVEDMRNAIVSIVGVFGLQRMYQEIRADRRGGVDIMLYTRNKYEAIIQRLQALRGHVSIDLKLPILDIGKEHVPHTAAVCTQLYSRNPF